VPRLLLLVATLWVGSLWTVGYIVAPTLFATLADRKLAGTIAGALFRVEAWLSLACALVILTAIFCCKEMAAAQRKALLRLIFAMLVCTLIMQFGLQPAMASLRTAAAAGGMTLDVKTYFGVLHGVAALVFFIQSMLGISLMLKLK